jgi:DNA-binding CsgD family transcriptional regulator/tetratricopeptide (TPR) repeat protein
VGQVEPPLVGRDEERATIERLLATTASGAAGVLVLEGEAGIGKSRLLLEARATAEDLGLAAVAVTGEPFEADRPFGVVEALLSELGAAVPTGWEDDPANAQHLVREATIEAAEAAVATGGLLLTFDDLQWADRPSLGVIASVVRRTAHLPLAVILAARPEPRRAVLSQLLGGERDRTVRRPLRPLAGADVAALAESVLGTPPGSDLRRHLDGAAGNPFLVVEAVRSLEQEELLERTAGEARLTGAPSSTSLRDSVRTRLADVGDGPLALLEAGSVLGRSFTLLEAGGLLDEDPATLARSARIALRSGLLDRVDDDRLAFRHDLVREALYDEVPLPHRDQLHRAAAETLAEAGADGITVGQHAAIGTNPGDHRSARWLLDAAAAAATYDSDAALGLLDHAAVAADGDSELQHEVAAARLTALAWSGRVAEAEAQAQAALGGRLDPREEALLEHRLGEALLVRGDAPAAVPHLRRALATGDLEGVDALRAGAWLAAAYMSSFDVPKALAAADDALAAIEADPVGDPEAEANVLATRCRLRAFQLDLDDALEDAARALTIVRGAPVLRRAPHLLCGHTLANADRTAEATTVLREGIAHAERHGQISALPMLHSALVTVGTMTGDWDSAATEGDLLLALCEETGVRAGRLEALALLAQIAHHRGEHDEVDDLLARCDDEMATPGHDGGGISITLWSKAFRAETAGDPAEGARLLGDAFALAVGLDVRWAQVAYGPDLARMAVAAGDRQTATYVADTVAPLGSRAGVDSAIAGVLACRGLADGSSDRLVEAADAFGRAGHPFEQAQSHEAAGDLLQARRRTREATDQLTRAADLYRQLGAAHHLAQVEDRPRDLADEPRPVMGWASLTPTEQEVARLVGDGLTNTEIAERQRSSRRTVETHVSRLYRKLDAPNRVVLAQQARDRNIPDAET